MWWAWTLGIIMPNSSFCQIKTIGLSPNAYTQLLQYLQFSDYTSTEVAMYRMVSVMLNLPRFHTSAFISQSNISQGMTPIRYIEKFYFSTFSSLRHSEVCFILKKLYAVTSNAPKPLFLFLAHRNWKSPTFCAVCAYIWSWIHAHRVQRLLQRHATVSSAKICSFLIIS